MKRRGNCTKAFILLWFPAMVLLFTAKARAQDELLWYDFENKVAPEFIHESISASEITVNSHWEFEYQQGADPNETTCANSRVWSSALFNPSEKRLEFSVTPQEGYELEISRISIWLGRSISGPRRVNIYYSLDGFVTDTVPIVENLEITSTGVLNLSYFPFEYPFGLKTTSTITFRIYGYRALGTGTLRFNDLKISGQVREVNPLPVELLSFSAIRADSKVLVTWSTATETNNDYFTIERSRDAHTAEVLGYITGAGNSLQVLHYHFFDHQPYSETAYYRLNQTDFDGSSKHSKWVAVADHSRKTDFTIHPINAAGRNWLKIVNHCDLPVEIVIFDLQGKIRFKYLLKDHFGIPFHLPVDYQGQSIMGFRACNGREVMNGKFIVGF